MPEEIIETPEEIVETPEETIEEVVPETTETEVEADEPEGPSAPATIADLVACLDNAYDNAKANALITGRGSFGVSGGIQGDYQVTVERV